MYLLNLWRAIFGCDWCKSRLCVCYTKCSKCGYMILPLSRCYCVNADSITLTVKTTEKGEQYISYENNK